MKEVILTVLSDKVTTVVFRGPVSLAVIRTFENPLGSETTSKSFMLYLYYTNIRVYEKRFAFNPSYFEDQLRTQKIALINVFERDITPTQWQDLYDLSNPPKDSSK